MKALHEVREYDGGFKFWGKQYKNIGFISHWHPEIELIYIDSGFLEININNKKFSAKTGDLVFINSGQIHFSVPNHFENKLRFILFDQSSLDNILFPKKYDINLIPRKMLKEHNLEKNTQLFFEIVIEELANMNPYSYEIIKG